LVVIDKGDHNQSEKWPVCPCPNIARGITGQDAKLPRHVRLVGIALGCRLVGKCRSLSLNSPQRPCKTELSQILPRRHAQLIGTPSLDSSDIPARMSDNVHNTVLPQQGSRNGMQSNARQG
jgi:hypothetical protein